MNYQNDCGCRCRISCCTAAVGFLALLLALSVGLIAGASLYETILPAAAALTAFTAAVAAILIALLIYCRCRR